MQDAYVCAVIGCFVKTPTHEWVRPFPKRFNLEENVVIRLCGGSSASWTPQKRAELFE